MQEDGTVDVYLGQLTDYDRRGDMCGTTPTYAPLTATFAQAIARYEV